MAYVYALFAIALWSTNAVTARFVLKVLPVEQVQFLQFFGAFIFFVILRFHPWQVREPAKFSATAWVLGIIGLAGTMFFQYIAFSIGPITEVNIIAYAWPLIAVIFIIIAGDAQRPAPLLALAIAGFIGAGLVIGGDQFFDFKFLTFSYGFAAAIISALCMAIYSFGIGRTSVNANDVLLPGAIVGIVITGIWCFSSDKSWDAQWVLLGGLYLGVGPMGAGYLFWSWAMQKDKNGHAALLGFLTPVTSTGLLLSKGASLEITSLFGAVILIVCCTIIGLQAHNQPHD